VSALLNTHTRIQQTLENAQITRQQLADIVADVEQLALHAPCTLAAALLELKQLPQTQRGVCPAATLELLLLAWSIHFRHVSKRYAQLLLSQSLISRMHSVQGEPKFPRSQLIRCARVVADDAWQGKALANSFARLVRYRNIEAGVQVMAESLWYQNQFLESYTDHKIRPLPHKLLHAIRSWPYNDSLFEKVLTALAAQPLLSRNVRDHATLQTEQKRRLSLKESLLLLGPEQSREVILITHFATHLTWPFIPLRAELLARRTTLAFLTKALAEHCQLALPCDADLLSYLWIYDAWFHADLSIQQHWQYQAQQSVPESVSRWQPCKTLMNHQRALKLAEYWQLPAATIPLLKMHVHENNRTLVCARIAHIATAVLHEYALSIPTAWQPRLTALCRAIQLPETQLYALLEQAAQALNIECPYQLLPL